MEYLLLSFISTVGDFIDRQARVTITNDVFSVIEAEWEIQKSQSQLDSNDTCFAHKMSITSACFLRLDKFLSFSFCLSEPHFGPDLKKKKASVKSPRKNVRARMYAPCHQEHQGTKTIPAHCLLELLAQLRRSTSENHEGS
jgi:hypothetical protein